MFSNSFTLFNSPQFNPWDKIWWIIIVALFIIGVLIAVFGFSLVPSS